jgi:hypothetical protein
MDKVVNVFRKAWSWFYERTALWCIFAFFALMSWGQLQKNELAIEINEAELNCKLECLPLSSEFIQNRGETQCWCYNDVNTLVKPQ